jgi:hypothetical protein
MSPKPGVPNPLPLYVHLIVAFRDGARVDLGGLPGDALRGGSVVSLH